jgi:hypothetical protein
MATPKYVADKLVACVTARYRIHTGTIYASNLIYRPGFYEGPYRIGNTMMTMLVGDWWLACS